MTRALSEAWRQSPQDRPREAQPTRERFIVLVLVFDSRAIKGQKHPPKKIAEKFV